MKLTFYCILAYTFILTTRSSMYPNNKTNASSLINNDIEKEKDNGPILAKRALQIPQNAKNENDTNEIAHFRMDPVLNYFKKNEKSNRFTQTNEFRSTNSSTALRHWNKRWRKPWIRKLETLHFKKNGNNGLPDKRANLHKDEENSLFKIDPVLNYFKGQEDPKISRRSKYDISSSREIDKWKNEMKVNLIHKKYKFIQSPHAPIRGDSVNMMAARPWGVRCGDPNQHNSPWGTCMMPMECDAEFRIQRGDYFCGRTGFVCCSLEKYVYDPNQALDLSFEDSDLLTDIDEKKRRPNSAEERERKRKLRKAKRKSKRRRNKLLIQRQIQRIHKEIGKIVKRQVRNASRNRKKRTKLLKTFVGLLKLKYKRDRQSIMDIHEATLTNVNDALKRKLINIMGLNENFVKNATFRDIVVNGTLNKQTARMLLEAYPELKTHINVNLRSGNLLQDYQNEDY